MAEAVLLGQLNNPKFIVPMYEEGVTLHMESGPGQGKTYTGRKWPALLSKVFGTDFGYFERNIADRDAPDVRGFVIPTKDETGRAVAKYTYPELMPSIEYFEKYPRGIAFYDEFNAADFLTRKAASTLINERMVGEYAFPDGWWIIMASNRVEDRSGAGKPLMHNINRVITLPVAGDVDTFCKIMEDQEIHPLLISFARSRPGTIFSDSVPSEPKPFATPRSFERASKLITRFIGINAHTVELSGTMQQIVGGHVGEGAAAEIFSYVKVADQLPTIEEILRNPTKCKVPSFDRLDASYAAVQMCVHHANAKNADPLWQFVERLPKEVQTSAAKSLLDKQGGALLNTKALGKWIANNKALIVSSTAGD